MIKQESYALEECFNLFGNKHNPGYDDMSNVKYGSGLSYTRTN